MLPCIGPFPLRRHPHLTLTPRDFTSDLLALIDFIFSLLSLLQYHFFKDPPYAVLNSDSAHDVITSDIFSSTNHSSAIHQDDFLPAR